MMQSRDYQQEMCNTLQEQSYSYISLTLHSELISVVKVHGEFFISMEILRLFLFIILVEGGTENQCNNNLIASGQGRTNLNTEQMKYVAESFKIEKGKNNLLLEWKLPKEYSEPCFHYRIKYRFLGKRIKYCEVPPGNWMEETADSTSYNIKDLLEFSNYEVSIEAEDVRGSQNGISFFILQNATFYTLEADELTEEHINIIKFDVHEENIIVHLANVKCSEIVNEIEVTFKIFCEDPRCTQELILNYTTPLENLTITLNATLLPSFHYNYTASTHRVRSGDRIIRRKKFISSEYLKY
ncbi:hypothetical protein WA026_004854 [Henosepilachna vigintioctopunctata]|uniref:Fibronectin type-III domain-containing protein n=1 Tax=Henosepilachna vigintioctopunctata TaxID=420089 RepID=A0AAW1UT00_9CUCU